MANLKLRYAIVAVLILLTALLVNNIQLEPSLDDSDALRISKTIPMQLGKWQGFDVQLDEEVYEILETKAIIHRNYVHEDGSQVFLSVVHYHDDSLLQGWQSYHRC